jgi:hypothetical protein
VINTADINAATAAYLEVFREVPETSGPIQPDLSMFRPRDDTRFGGAVTGIR